MPQDFLNIPPSECLNVHKEILQNSDKHYNLAHYLSENKDYGMAVSHLVLGSEELVKAIIIYFEGIGFNIRRIKGMSALFNSHKPRHNIASHFGMVFPLVYFAMEIFMEIIEYIRNPKSKNKINELAVSIIEMDKDKVEQIMLNWFENDGHKFINNLLLQSAFWQKADDYKMRGFYVDYKDKLLSPKDISENEYQFAYETTASFKVQCIKILNYVKNISSEERELLVKEYKKSIDFEKTIKQILDYSNIKNKKK